MLFRTHQARKDNVLLFAHPEFSCFRRLCILLMSVGGRFEFATMFKDRFGQRGCLEYNWIKAFLQFHEIFWKVFIQNDCGYKVFFKVAQVSKFQCDLRQAFDPFFFFLPCFSCCSKSRKYFLLAQC